MCASTATLLAAQATAKVNDRNAPSTILQRQPTSKHWCINNFGCAMLPQAWTMGEVLSVS